MRGDKIVLVEANSDHEFLIVSTLKKNGIAKEVVVLRDGAEAIDYFIAGDGDTPLDKSDLPAVVLLSSELPKFGGIEVLRRLRVDDRTRFLPVVMMISSNGERDLLKSYNLGVNSCIRKSADLGEIAAAIKETCFYWLVLNEPPQNNTNRRDKGGQSNSRIKC